MDTWAKVSVSSVIHAFMKAVIITEQLSTGNSNETDLDNDECDMGRLKVEITKLLNLDTEDKKIDGFVGEE